jgi:hypothetical protein
MGRKPKTTGPTAMDFHRMRISESDDEDIPVPSVP